MNSFQKIAELSDKFNRSLAPTVDEVQKRLKQVHVIANEDIARLEELFKYYQQKYNASEQELKTSENINHQAGLKNEMLEIYRQKEEQKILIRFVKEFLPMIRKTFMKVVSLDSTGDRFQEGRAAFLAIKELIGESNYLANKISEVFREQGYFPNMAELYCLPALKQISFDYQDAYGYSDLEALNDRLQAKKSRDAEELAEQNKNHSMTPVTAILPGPGKGADEVNLFPASANAPKAR